MARIILFGFLLVAALISQMTGGLPDGATRGSLEPAGQHGCALAGPRSPC